MLAILKLGAAFLPINNNDPQSRVENLLNNSKANLFINKNNFSNFLQKTKHKVSNINFPNITVAYIMYTSGTTGISKGVMVSHKNVINCCCPEAKTQFSKDIQQSDNVAIALSSANFDASISEIIQPLLNGGTVVYADRHTSVCLSLVVVLARKH